MTANTTLHTVINLSNGETWTGDLSKCMDLCKAEALAGNTKAKIVSARSLEPKTQVAKTQPRVVRSQFDVRMLPVARQAIETLKGVSADEAKALKLGQAFRSIMSQATDGRTGLSSKQYALLIGWAAQVVSYRKSTPDIERMMKAVTA
jgi:hypothetical protein